MDSNALINSKYGHSKFYYTVLRGGTGHGAAHVRGLNK